MVLYNTTILGVVYINLVSIAGLAFAYNYHALRYFRISWTSCLTSESVAETLQGVAFKQCLQGCVFRHHCKGVNYWTRGITCEIVDNVSGITVDMGDGPCAYVHKEDIFGTYVASDNCSTCTEYSVCDREGSCTEKGCPKPYVENAISYGNVWSVGARAKIVCPYGSTSGINTTWAICQRNGTWSMNAIVSLQPCDKPPIKPNSMRVYTSIGVYANATYTCRTGYVVQQNGVRTNMNTHTATCNSAAKSWAGLNFTCVSGCAQYDINVKISNMTLMFGWTRLDHATAEAVCQQVGELLRLDTFAKYAAIQTYMSNGRGCKRRSFWVQGEYDGRQWAFNNGEPMLLDDRMWNVDTLRKCVTLTSNWNFTLRSRDCASYCIYICEII